MSQPIRRRRILAATIALVCATPACTAGPTTEPPPATSPTSAPPTSTSRAAPPPSVPPPVTRVLDASAYRGETVCGLLTRDQADAHGLVYDSGSTIADFRVTRCHWAGRIRVGLTGLSLQYFYDQDWLGSIYRREHLYWRIDGFVPITVAGQPAVRSEEPRDPRSCRVAVGLAADQTIELSAYAEGQACDRAVAIAEEIVRNLGG